MTDVLPGAEPFSAAGGPHGALVVHGFTGCPQSMRGLAQAFAAAGFATELPLLPGHGTSVDDMLATRWADWSGAAEAAYENLAARCDRIVVAGLSMGGTITAIRSPASCSSTRPSSRWRSRSARRCGTCWRPLR